MMKKSLVAVPATAATVKATAMVMVMVVLSASSISAFTTSLGSQSPMSFLSAATERTTATAITLTTTTTTTTQYRGFTTALHMSDDDDDNDNADDEESSNLPTEWRNTDLDSNVWRTTDELEAVGQVDWETTLKRKEDGSFWSDFELEQDNNRQENANDDKNNNNNLSVNNDNDDANTNDGLVEDYSEAWLDTLAAISAEEVEFNMEENRRAEKAQEMAEWGFDKETIKNTFGIAVDDELEKEDEIEGMQNFRDESYWEDDEDWKQVESHTKVEKDEETGEPIRQQMVYVDEHTCIGCTNCAMVAQSTFFMDDEHGRARVFQQWGDDEETVAVAIETCPVDCIHYVPYDELVRLEVERRDQNINFKARLVNQADNRNGFVGGAGGPNGFTPPQQISGNMGSRCNNCPSRGCRDCPMFGVGKNPEYERKEKERLAKRERRRLEQMREEQQKSVDL